MRTAVIALAVVALAGIATAQTVSGTFCTGYNFTLNNAPGFTSVQGYTNVQCPYGFVMDVYQSTCITYRQAINNFMGASCVSANDCGSWSGNPLTCGYMTVNSPTGVCTWSKTRAQNDSCISNVNCFGYENRTSAGVSTVVHGCDKVTKICRPQTQVYTAQLGDRCNYEDGANYVNCAPPLYYCGTTSTPASNCFAYLDIGQKCNTLGSGYGSGCRTDAVCFGQAGNVNNTCQLPVANGAQCYRVGSTVECSQTGSTAGQVCGLNPTASQYVCQSYLTVGQACSTSNPNNQYQPCGNNLNCVSVNGAFQCVTAYSYSNETCVGRTCAPGLTCISSQGKCFFGNVTDPCALVGSGTGQYRDTCQPGLVCVTSTGSSQLTCQPQVGVGQNCTLAGTAQCLSGLNCINTTCVAPQTLGQPCDPVAYLGKFTTLVCNSTLQCSRGTCIAPNSVQLGNLCSQDSDCDTSYCDRTLMRCTRRRMCSASFNENNPSAGKVQSCTCVCLGGINNPGQCILNNCVKQAWALLNCTNPLFYNPYSNATGYQIASSVAASYAWLDSQSSFYTKCQSQHAAWVGCQALMNKWGAPSVPLGDLLNYDFSSVSGSSIVSVSIMVMVASIMSLFMLL